MISKLLNRYRAILVILVVIGLLAAFLPSKVHPQAAAVIFRGPLIPSNDLPGAYGKTVSGLECKPGVRQVTWSSYAPICQPAWSGNNGGSTSPGVTSKTITITFRYAVPPQVQELIGLIHGNSIVGTEQQAVSTMQDYINLFNKTFELYGRKVILKPFTGRGDFLSELSGQGQAQAQSDAAVAKSLNAFADVSLLFSTPPYDQALAQNHIIAITGGLYQSASWFNQYAPYVYSTSPDCNMVGNATAAIVKNAMANNDAIYSTNPAYQHHKRVFALIAPDNPMYQSCAKSALSSLKQNNIQLATTIGYKFDLTGASGLSANTIAQLKSDGVTTVLCACDPITPLFLTLDALQLNYHPEWMTLDWGDQFGQLLPSTEMNNAISGGQISVPRSQEEAYKALLLAHVPKSQINPLYSSIYAPLLLLFDALQEAGPDLNVYTFEKGFWSIPKSEGSMSGVWQTHQGSYVAQASYDILYWDANVVSPLDDKKGTWLACNNSTIYYYSNPSKGLVKGKQLQCGNR
jgi:hypothetical protein